MNKVREPLFRATTIKLQLSGLIDLFIFKSGNQLGVQKFSEIDINPYL